MLLLASTASLYLIFHNSLAGVHGSIVVHIPKHATSTCVAYIGPAYDTAHISVVGMSVYLNA